jgi:hypothetical protein
MIQTVIRNTSQDSGHMHTPGISSGVTQRHPAVISYLCTTVRAALQSANHATSDTKKTVVRIAMMHMSWVPPQLLQPHSPNLVWAAGKPPSFSSKSHPDFSKPAWNYPIAAAFSIMLYRVLTQTSHL